MFVAPPGAFPREADRGLCNFLHVPLMPNPKISDFERLDGACSLDPRCLYSGSGLFRGYIERFSNFHSTGRRNFALAREFLWLHSLKWQIRRKSRYMESKIDISEKLLPQSLWPERARKMNVSPWQAGHLSFDRFEKFVFKKKLVRKFPENRRPKFSDFKTFRFHNFRISKFSDFGKFRIFQCWISNSCDNFVCFFPIYTPPRQPPHGWS